MKKSVILKLISAVLLLLCLASLTGMVSAAGETFTLEFSGFEAEQDAAFSTTVKALSTGRVDAFETVLKFDEKTVALVNNRVYNFGNNVKFDYDGGTYVAHSYLDNEQPSFVFFRITSGSGADYAGVTINNYQDYSGVYELVTDTFEAVQDAFKNQFGVISLLPEIMINVTGNKVRVSWIPNDTNVNGKQMFSLQFKAEENLAEGEYSGWLALDDESETFAEYNDSPLAVNVSMADLSIYGFGDVNFDHKVDTRDALRVRQHYLQVEGRELTGLHFKLGDVNFDSKLNTRDALAIQRYKIKLTDVLGNRINVRFFDADGNLYMTKSVVVNRSIASIPDVPAKDGYSNGQWSLSASEYVAPSFSNIQAEMNVYAYYGLQVSDAMDHYKKVLTTKYYSGDIQTGLAGDMDLVSDLVYQGDYTAKIYWASSNNATLNSTTGKFSMPSYDSNVTLSATIVSYKNNLIEMTDTIDFVYSVKGLYKSPSKTEVANWLKKVFENGVDYNIKLPLLISNKEMDYESPFELRVEWNKIDNGLHPVSEIARSTSTQILNLEATVTFNGMPLEGDGKVLIEDVSVKPIEEREVREYVINEVALNTGLSVTNGEELWHERTPYSTNVRWITGNKDIATVNNNIISISNLALNGTLLPLTLEVTYDTDEGAKTFYLYYTVSVVTDNSLISRDAQDVDMYDALRAATGVSGDLTTEALKANTFVYLDLSKYPDIQDLSLLAYCVNLRVLNISGLRITKGFNAIATLSKLEALIAKDCDLTSFGDGMPVLSNAVNLKLLDLSHNHFKNLSSVLSVERKYGKLAEVYLNDNELEDISGLSRAPALNVLVLSENGLTSEKIAPIAGFRYLTYLSLADNRIDDISALSNLRCLIELRLHNNQISNVRDLKRLTNLEALYLGGNQIVGNIQFINNLTKLRVLYLNDNSIEDISSLTALDKLESINVSRNNIDSLSVLGEHYSSTLKEVYAESNNIRSFSFIQPLTELRVLMLSDNAGERQGSLTSYLAGLTKLETLTLSGQPISDLSFLGNMNELIRLDLENCDLPAYYVTNSLVLTDNETGTRTLEISEYVDNIQQILTRKSKLKVLNISNNNMAYYTDEMLAYMARVQGINANVSGITFTGNLPSPIEALRDMDKLMILYADNTNKVIDAYQMTGLMTGLRYLSLEQAYITDMSWLSNFRYLIYVDLANNYISNIDLGTYIVGRSRSTLEYLYLDTLAENATFANAYDSFDGNGLKELSLQNVKISSMAMLPYMENIEFLNLENTGLPNLLGPDPDMYDLHWIYRYGTLDSLDLSHVEIDLTPLTTLDSLKTLYANAQPNEQIFHMTDIRVLDQLCKKGVTCYLYDDTEPLVPNSATEGAIILDEIEDFSRTVQVAADNEFSNNNPVLPETVNDFPITWSVSNEDNYELVNNQLSVRDYTNIDDEDLILTASIVVYEDQVPATRSFVIHTNILRTSEPYVQIDATGLADAMKRSEEFTYKVSIVKAKTENFTNPVAPVADDPVYHLAAFGQNGTELGLSQIIVSNGNQQYTISEYAELGGYFTINSVVGHTIASGFVEDYPIGERSATITSRSFNVTFEANGGTVKSSSDGAAITQNSFEEGAPIFASLTVERAGYKFDGWYTDALLTELFSATGEDAVMPSHDITLYAKWNPISFKVYLDANGGTCATEYINALSDVALGTLPTPTLQYYTFDGWFTAKDGGVKVTAETKFTRNEDITVYAHWTRNSFIVTFNANGGSVSQSTLRGYCGQKLGTLPTPTRDYYSFDGWFTAASGGTQVTANTIYTVAQDITVYAHWTIHPTSDWVLASSVPAGAQIVDRKWTFTLTSTPALSSWPSSWSLLDSSYVWSDWGSWSDWSNSYAESSDSVQVETRWIAPTYRTEYNYSRYNEYDYATAGRRGWNGPTQGYWGGHYCQYYEERGWSTEQLSYAFSDSGYDCYGYSGYYWYNQQTRQVEVTAGYTQYRYRTRNQIWTYHFESTEYPTGNSVTDIKEWIKYRAK